ncbi:hypothetical protein CJD36_000550 [Flavipsychrobacter stenotrophus]|uniref:Uncharacterized protein n=1 Tax=Flavipsychrobacter stenotrophus TaxID=2077091 RepID=A0A2S7SZC9_9BACT|nr:hypothetical protein [Flavipsychrobacter stenotrophus]PQJ12282.1 hypothetical protein CJD36_000550 [Flavipsychrobacter stenotrophus]
MDQPDKNIWVNEVMDSLAGMQRVPPPHGMYEGVMSRVRTSRNNLRVLLPRVAAAAVLLLAVNIFSVYHATKAKQTTQTGVYQLVDEQISNLSEGSF